MDRNGRSYVLSAGILRAGSTWLYNAARLSLLEEYPDLCAGWVKDMRIEAIGPPALIKIHRPNEDLAARADVILTCHRDLRDIVLSACSMGWATDVEAMVKFARRVRKHHDFWAQRSAVDLAYGEIVTHPHKSVAAVMQALGINGDVEKIALSLDVMPPYNGDGQHDPVTLLHRDHRQNGGGLGRWQRELSTEVCGRILDEHGDWLQLHGYKID
jgi:hypothetical protein